MPHRLHTLMQCIKDIYMSMSYPVVDGMRANKGAVIICFYLVSFFTF